MSSSIFLEGQISESTASINWKGCWYFTKDKKSDQKFEYKLEGHIISQDFMDYVSFKSRDALEGPRRGRGRGRRFFKKGTSDPIDADQSTFLQNEDKSSDSLAVCSDAEGDVNVIGETVIPEVREVEIAQTMRYFGLWTGSFEVSAAGSASISIPETFFLFRDYFDESSEFSCPSFEDLPPKPQFSSSVLRKDDLISLLPHLSLFDPLEEKKSLNDNEVARFTKDNSKVLYGFGRNQFGRFSIIVIVNETTGETICEKKYMLTKYGTALASRALEADHCRYAVGNIKRVRKDSEVSAESGAVSRSHRSGSDAAAHSSSVLDQTTLKRRRVGSSKMQGYLSDVGEHTVEEGRGDGDDNERKLGLSKNHYIDENDSDDYRSAFIDDESGEVYEGGWYYDRRHGMGICLFSDGTMYEGTWMFGQEHGYGRLLNSDRTLLYDGEWLDGLMNGQGSYYYLNGDKYLGDWKEGYRHGRGEYTMATGCRYCGDWKDNKRQGKGVFTWTNGSTYDGEWENDMRHGRGLLQLTEGFTYDGLWANNFMDGRGVCIFSGKQEYHGAYKQGLREGRGSIQFSEGAVYEGRFREDRIDGQGTIKVEQAVPGFEAGETLIPIQIQADIRRIHLKAGFGQDEIH